MRGFLLGTVVLVALYAALRPDVAPAVQAGGSAFTAALRRVLSPTVAGVAVVGQTRNAGTGVGKAVAGGVGAGVGSMQGR